jgi:hypothetical protein
LSFWVAWWNLAMSLSVLSWMWIFTLSNMTTLYILHTLGQLRENTSHNFHYGLLLPLFFIIIIVINILLYLTHKLNLSYIDMYVCIGKNSKYKIQYHLRFQAPLGVPHRERELLSRLPSSTWKEDKQYSH